jgi:hypothetical protein
LQTPQRVVYLQGEDESSVLDELLIDVISGTEDIAVSKTLK